MNWSVFGRQIFWIFHRELKVYRNLPQQFTAILPVYNVKWSRISLKDISLYISLFQHKNKSDLFATDLITVQQDATYSVYYISVTSLVV